PAAACPPSVSALSVRVGRCRAVCHTLAVLPQAATNHECLRAVCGVLRSLPLLRRILPRAGRPYRLSGLWLADHGSAALYTYDFARCRLHLVGVSQGGCEA